VTDDFRDIESRLLRFEAFNQATTAEVLSSAAAREASPCDSHTQRALLLMEIPLADAALRSGALNEYSRRTQAMEIRARELLACTPRDSFVWLVLFGIATGHGNLDQSAFDLLAMSYETSPNEAWVANRRIMLAIPVLRSAPEPIQERILGEFQELVRRGFVDIPALAYLGASEPVRASLRARIEALDERTQKAFTEAIKQRRT